MSFSKSQNGHTDNKASENISIRYTLVEHAEKPKSYCGIILEIMLSQNSENVHGPDNKRISAA